MWKFTGQQRPEFAVIPTRGQESVWDYPRPPAIVHASMQVEIRTANQLIARSNECLRICETASPPTIYIPPAAVNFDSLVPAQGTSFCEWKGAAQYWALADNAAGAAVGWSYPAPRRAFAALRDWLCFYPGRIECYLDGERVRPQEGGFYGGWVTANIVGPWKGQAGTGGW